MASARRSLIAAHEALADAKDQIGLRRVTLVGGGDKTGGDIPRTGHLREIKSA